MVAPKKPVANKKPTPRKPRAKKPTEEVKATNGLVSHVSVETLIEDAPESERVINSPEYQQAERKLNHERALAIINGATHLTEKQRLFIVEYTKSCNGTKAALAAGYSKSTAKQMGVENLSKPSIKDVLDQITNDRASRGLLDGDLLMEIWQDRTLADPNSISQYRRVACRFCYGEGFRYQMTPSEYERALEDHAKMNEKRAKDELPELPFDPKGGIGYNGTRDPHPDCPECWGEGVGRLHFGDTRKLSKEDRRLYAGAKKTKDGVEVMMHSQPDSEDKTAKALGLYKDKVEVALPSDLTPEKLSEKFADAIAIAQARQAKIAEERAGNG